MPGRRRFTIAFVATADGDEALASKLRKYGILFDMMGIVVRTTACYEAELRIVQHMKNRYIFLPGKPTQGYSENLGKIIENPTPIAYATAKKYGGEDDMHCSAAAVHTLMGYSLKSPADLVMVYYPSGSNPNDPRLAIIAAFISKTKRAVINVAEPNWEKQLTEVLAQAGFAKEVEAGGQTVERSV